MAGKNIHEGLQHHWFFAIDCASANNHGTGVPLFEGLTQACNDRRSGWRGLIKLKISGHTDALRRRANFLKSSRIFAGLRQEKIYVLQNSGYKTPEAPISRRRAV